MLTEEELVVQTSAYAEARELYDTDAGGIARRVAFIDGAVFEHRRTQPEGVVVYRCADCNGYSLNPVGVRRCPEDCRQSRGDLSGPGDTRSSR